jgi:hypothetical protein
VHNIPNAKKRGVEVEDTVAKRLKFNGGEDQLRLMLHSLMTTVISSRT